MYSTDEKMGIQAKEHKNANHLMQGGQAERVDPEYIRHGTSGLIGSRNVAIGEIVAPMIQTTRTEEDFAQHVLKVTESTPTQDKNIFIADNLNIHKSET